MRPISPGPGSPSYFSHAYLARYLGYTVVESGDLTVRDKTKSITLPVTDVKIEGKTLTCKATVKLNRHDFGIEYNSAIGDYAINDMCDLVLDVIAETK